MRTLAKLAALCLTPVVLGAQSVDLTGAGATFPYPIYSKWFADYAAKTGVKINYQSIGSGGGIRQLSDGTVDFGASDSPMTDGEMQKAKGGRVLHFPTVIGAVAVVYNVPGIAKPLNLDGSTLSDIFLGKLRKWNDGKIAKLNPGVSLPARDIVVVHRSDGSGTTYIFTDFLASSSKEWLAGPGRSKEVAWPIGLGGKGNDGVASQVKQIPGAIGYVELAYARQTNLSFAAVRNSAGSFVLPSVESATAAADGVASKLNAKSDYRISIVNAPGAQAYPVTSFTWLLAYQDQTDPIKGKKLVDFMRWALTSGQAAASALDYAPLPKVVAGRLVERLGTIRLAGGAATQ
ncbi:MAG TPA: phosphate ABC transporter substrate-binding protein PstS [Gemmatimonadaceae bacterium]|nr:phosphate ABC transporter substrate-binding protein PstS [Gemmatimonadaceae bacterium]